MQFYSDPEMDLPNDDPNYIPDAYRNELIRGAEHTYVPKRYGHTFTQRVLEEDFAFQRHDFYSTVPDV